MKKILITGGPVHAHLDAVKVITNRFRGGLMCQLAEALLEYGFDGRGFEVTYLCAPSVGAKQPRPHERLTVITHSGFESYREAVLQIAPRMDAVVLGAAVANLIPAKPYAGKFPSHNYKPGDIIPIDFKIAPRVIDEVKAAAPKAQLFGYKLLSGVSQEELIRAAYGIVLEAGATAVFANDAENLDQKFAVTKERGVHPVSQSELALWIAQMLADEYYATAFVPEARTPLEGIERIRQQIHRFSNKFLATESGLLFGTVAERFGNGFMTTGRGKRELDSIACVMSVDHNKRRVHVAGGKKASLNAPLLGKLFENPEVNLIVHYHEQEPGLPTYPYAPPGTVRDTERPNATSFNINEHGCMLLFNSKGERL